MVEPGFEPRFLFLIEFIYWLCWVFVAACGFSLVVGSWGYSLVAIHGLIAVASLVVEEALGTRASVVVALGLQSTGPVVVVHRFCCSEARGIFPDRAWNLCPLHWQADSYPLCYQAGS